MVKVGQCPRRVGPWWDCCQYINIHNIAHIDITHPIILHTMTSHITDNRPMTSHTQRPMLITEIKRSVTEPKLDIRRTFFPQCKPDVHRHKWQEPWRYILLLKSIKLKCNIERFAKHKYICSYWETELFVLNRGVLSPFPCSVHTEILWETELTNRHVDLAILGPNLFLDYLII